MLRSKREIVFLSAAALAAAYAVYALALAPKRVTGARAAATARPTTATSATAGAIAQIQQEIGRTTISALVRLAAGRAGEEWGSTLFLGAPLPDELKQRDDDRREQQQQSQTAQQEAEAKSKAAAEQERQRLAESQRRFDYTGYVSSGGRFYAVINGAVYQVGDRLDGTPDCSVKSIAPESVAIEDGGRAVTVQVPLRLDWAQTRLEPGQHDKP